MVPGNVLGGRRKLDVGAGFMTPRHAGADRASIRRGLLLTSALVPALALSLAAVAPAFAAPTGILIPVEAGGAGGDGGVGRNLGSGPGGGGGGGSGGGGGGGGGSGAATSGGSGGQGGYDGTSASGVGGTSAGGGAGGIGGGTSGAGGSGVSTSGAGGAGGGGNADGQSGVSGGSGGGGGGGGGGGHGYFGSALPTASVNGGAGGSGGFSVAAGGGGGGGGGGFGAIVVGGGNLGELTTSVIGGAGGSGGGSGGPPARAGKGGAGGGGLFISSVALGAATINGGVLGGQGGAGGDGAGSVGGAGGSGIYVDNASGGDTFALDLKNLAVVAGGAGGANSLYTGGAGGVGIAGSNLSIALAAGAQVRGGAGGDATNAGVGGVGISGSSLSITLAAGSAVSGGLDGFGVTRANAIHFTGGTNVLTLMSDSSISGYAQITGNVVGGGNDTLRLAGSGAALFDLTQLDGGAGGSTKFQSFEAVSITGGGTWALMGTQGGTDDIAWTIDGGTARLGSLGPATLRGTVTVNTGGTLTHVYPGGTQTIQGSLIVNSGGRLVLTAQQGMPAINVTGGSLNLNTGSFLFVTLLSPTATPLLTVQNDLEYKGTLYIPVKGQLAEGTYTLASYGGNIISGSGFSDISGPSDFDYAVSVDTTNKLLLLEVATPILYWNGTTTDGSTSAVVGGFGTWSAAGTTNWTNSGGTSHVVWASGKAAAFAGTSGIVRVDTSAGAVVAKGLEFITSGYQIAPNSAGDQLTLANASAKPKVNVVGAFSSAGISVGIIGSDGLEKTGDGRLILLGENSYTGGTTITAGTLQLGGGGTSGSITSDVVNNGTLVFNRADDVIFAGVISGTGKLEKQGGGTLRLAGANTYSGGTSVSAGTVQVYDGGALGGGSLALSGGGTLRASGSF
ncbi:autotransporter-associated beta strand repeat-containing protein, partial [Xanthobacter sp. V0B-10]|uniref:autotransporter-associated beta strand repeat-containing protein n=1 Tax=Xanthobacter albus TaxID=3119929 RepID=UPI00372AE6D5